MEYVGIHGDGWVEREARVVLPGGGARNLILRAEVPPREHQRLEVFVDGLTVVSEAAPAGLLDLRVPLETTEPACRIELRWAEAGPPGPDDPRQVAALLKFIDLVPLRPVAGLSVPDGLAAATTGHGGIHADGWTGASAHVILAGGKASHLVVRGEALTRQHLEVLMDRDRLWSGAVAPGPLDLEVPIPASESPRRVELRWTDTARLSADDAREVAARLSFVGLATAPAVVRLPAALMRGSVRHSGIHPDGWAEQRAELVVAGGAAADLVVQGEVLPPGQTLEVSVNGRTLFSSAVEQGRFRRRIAVPASESPRRVELAWARTAAPSPADARQVAARLELVGLAARPPSGLWSIPKDLEDPIVEHAGIYPDGWLEREASVVLAGGAPQDLLVRADVLPHERQRLEVVVDERTVALEDVEAGPLDLRIPLAGTDSDRRVELRWAAATPVGPNDPRDAAALLQRLALGPPGQRGSPRSRRGRSSREGR